jgi:hypothetical protein
LREVDIGEVGDERGFNSVVGGVAEFSGKSKGGGFVGGVEFGIGKRMVQGNVAAGRKKDFTPDAGVFVGRRGIPVDPG